MFIRTIAAIFEKIIFPSFIKVYDDNRFSLPLHSSIIGNKNKRLHLAQISFANEVTMIFFLIPLQEEKASQLFVPPPFRVQRKRVRKRALHPNVLNTFYYLEAIVTWKFSIFSLPALLCCVFKCSCVFKRNLITQSLPDQRQR